MKTLVPRSLRWQFVLALFGLVAFTLLVSWALAVRFTARDFEAFVTEEALAQAREVAHLIEARVNVYGELGNLEELLSESTADASGEPDDSEVLWEMETESIPEWDWILADELELSLEAYWDETSSRTPAELAEERGRTSEELVSAIMRDEAEWVREYEHIDSADLVYYLGSVLEDVEAYVEGWEARSPEALIEDPDAVDLPYLYETPVLVVDLRGAILFDGSGRASQGTEIAFTEDTERLPIRSWRTGDAIGFVLPARDPWFYDAEEASYLGRTRDGLLIGGATAAALALLLGTFLSYRITRPVIALRDSAVRLSAGEPVERLPVSPGELGSMSAAFNAMADALDQQREVRKRMVSDLSHELNTPLAVIQLEIEALRDGMQSPQEAADHVLSELGLLRNLASDVGLLAENEAGLLSIHKEEVDLAVFVPGAVSRWETQAESVGIVLRVAEIAHPIPVELDATRISQALGNLIRNALQHTPSGGRIDVSMSRRSVDRLDGIWNTLCVADTGRGIAPEHLDRIFERAIRGQANPAGRGLGLTIVRQIVEAHGGHVWAESDPGKGSVFCIALP